MKMSLKIKTLLVNLDSGRKNFDVNSSCANFHFHHNSKPNYDRGRWPTVIYQTK